MGLPAAASIVLSAALAVAGYLATYLNGVRIAQRKDRLELANRRLSEFYGPLLSLVHISTDLWQRFTTQQVQRFGTWSEEGFASQEGRKNFELWMHEVFMPLNEQVFDLIVSKAELLQEDEMPQVLLDASANAWGWKPVLRSWTDGRDTWPWSLVTYPYPEIVQYADRGYKKAKQEQQSLLTRLRA